MADSQQQRSQTCSLQQLGVVRPFSTGRRFAPEERSVNLRTACRQLHALTEMNRLHISQERRRAVIAGMNVPAAEAANSAGAQDNSREPVALARV